MNRVLATMIIRYRLMKDRTNRLNKTVGGNDGHDGMSNPLWLLANSGEIQQPQGETIRRIQCLHYGSCTVYFYLICKNYKEEFSGTCGSPL